MTFWKAIWSRVGKGKSSGPVRNDADRDLAAMDICYEYCEFRRCYYMKAKDAPAYSDAHLTHARALAEFLVRRKSERRNPKPNDVTPGQIVPGWKPPDSGAVGRLRTQIGDMDRHLSHITWTRVEWEKNKRVWDFDQLNADLIEAFTDFATAAKAANVPGWQRLDDCLKDADQWK